MTKPITAVKATIGAIDRISDNQTMMTLTASDEHHAFVVSTGNIVDSVRRALHQQQPAGCTARYRDVAA